MGAKITVVVQPQQGPDYAVSLSLPPLSERIGGDLTNKRKPGKKKKPNTRVEIEQKVNLTVMTEENNTGMEHKYSTITHNRSPQPVSSK